MLITDRYTYHLIHFVAWGREPDRMGSGGGESKQVNLRAHDNDNGGDRFAGHHWAVTPGYRLCLPRSWDTVILRYRLVLQQLS